MEIRFAQKKDLAQIIDLCKTHATYEKAGYDPENKAALLSEVLFGQNSNVQCFVVAQENSILGYATFMKQFSTWDAQYYMYLDCLFLKEETRGQGLGARIMKKIIALAKNENCDHMQWQTPTFNIKARDFYQKMGGVSKSKERFSMNLT